MERDLETIWEALHCARTGSFFSLGDGAWDEVCKAMANVHEALGIQPDDEKGGKT